MKYIYLMIIGALMAFNIQTCIERNKYEREYNEETKRLDDLRQSIDSVSKIVPDTIIRDSVVYDTITHTIVKHISAPPSGAKLFSDTLVNKNINASVHIVADNVYSIKWRYKPIFRLQTVEVTKYAPIVVAREKQTYTTRNSMYFTGSLGYWDEIAASIDLTLITKKKRVYRLGYTRFGDKGAVMAGYGFRF